MKAFCPTCEEHRETRIAKRAESYKVRGQEIVVPVQSTTCAKCGETLGSDEDDRRILAAVYSEYRRQQGFLKPEEIQEIRRRYRLSQKSFAALLGMSEATINRYEQGALQDTTHETALRACEDPAFVRGRLRKRGNLLTPWQRKRVQDVLEGQAASESEWPKTVSGLDWIQTGGEVSDRTGFRRFDYERYAAVLTWFCRKFGKVSRTVINKLLFYADFLQFKTSSVSLTGTAYRKLQYGPVPSNYGVLLDQMEAKGLIVCKEVVYLNGRTGFEYEPGPQADSPEVCFTEQEKKVLARVAKEFERMTPEAISDRSHQEAAWRDTAEKKLISYQKAAKLSLDL